MAGMKLNAGQLRAGSAKCKVQPFGFAQGESAKSNKNEIYIILDNVLDTYNVGSIFRLADAVGAKKVYLCGGTETPPNPRIKKASINTTEWVEWEYAPAIGGVIKNLKLKIKNLQTVAVEQSATAAQYDKFEYKMPICLIVGNETYGVSKEVLEEVDGIVELPMFGVNISLNVMVSLGIVLYKVVGEAYCCQKAKQ